MSEVQDVVEFKPEGLIAQGDKVIVLGRFTMHVKATGRASAPRGYMFGQLKGGASVRYVNM